MEREVTTICIILAAGVFLGDLWLKGWVEKRIKEGENRPLLSGKLIVRKHHNRGAMLNAGQKHRPFIAVLSLILTTVVAVLFLLSLGHRGNNLLRVGLSFLLGGAFSNTYDRLRRKYVVDYLSFGVKWPWFREIVFNLSDFSIIIGALLAALGYGF